MRLPAFRKRLHEIRKGGRDCRENNFVPFLWHLIKNKGNTILLTGILFPVKGKNFARGEDKMMTIKRKLFEKSLWLHRCIARQWGKTVEVNFPGMLKISPMQYDKVSVSCQIDYNKYEDYVRYRSMELAVEEICRRYSREELKDFAVAEAGVFLGDFAWLINRKFPENPLYLYDTFEGFDTRDIAEEMKGRYTGEEHMTNIDSYFKAEDLSGDKKIAIVKSKMDVPERCIFRKGYFPETAKNERKVKWIFVSLDMDLYQPILEGILFFYPNLVPGGYIFVHDYNNVEYRGLKDALKEAELRLGEKIPKFALCDRGGTIVLTKI